MPAPESVVAAALEQGFAVFALRADAKIPVTEHDFRNATTRPNWILGQVGLARLCVRGEPASPGKGIPGLTRRICMTASRSVLEEGID
jgi:hypothetical protein